MPSEFVVYRRAVLPEDEGRIDFRGKFKTREEAEHYIDAEDDNGRGYFKRGDFSINEVEEKSGPSAQLTQAMRDSLAIEEGQSPLAEASATSLDELYDRINRKLAQGLVLDIYDGDIQALTADLRAQRLRWVQEQQRGEMRPKRRTPRSVNEALQQVSAKDVEI